MDADAAAAAEEMLANAAEAHDGGRKRRFTEAQIRSLETTFGAQAKLEARQKAALARELGLQPRQVSIWFQNKRARWKTKQLEKEHAALRDDYEALRDSYDALKKEKQFLLKQLEKLATMLKDPDHDQHRRPVKECYVDARDGEVADADGDVTDNRLLRSGRKGGDQSDPRKQVYSDDVDDSEFMSFGDDDQLGVAAVDACDTRHGTTEPADMLHLIHPGWLADEAACGGSHWWDFESLSG